MCTAQFISLFTDRRGKGTTGDIEIKSAHSIAYIHLKSFQRPKKDFPGMSLLLMADPWPCLSSHHISLSPVLAPPRCLCCRLSVCQTTPVAVSAYPVCMAAGTARNAERNGRGLRPPSASAQSARAKTKSHQKHSSCRPSQWRTSFSKALSIMGNTEVVLSDNYGKHVT